MKQKIQAMAFLASLAALTACTSSQSAPTAEATRAPTGAPIASPWPAQPAALPAQGAAPSPEFPKTMVGWSLDTSWSDLPRAFAGTTWTALSGPAGADFPFTLNGCDSQRFLVRWRGVTADAQIAARWGQGAAKFDKSVAADATNFGTPVVAHAGWLDINGCYLPEFKLQVATSKGATLSDVTVRVQRWVPAP